MLPCSLCHNSSPSGILILKYGSCIAMSNSLEHCRSFRRLFSAQNVFASNAQIASLSRAGMVDAARQLFDEMPKKDIVSWNAIITTYWKNGYFNESKRLFDIMPEKNVVSWNCMIAGCIANKNIEEAYTYFRIMPERNTASWNAIISGFIRHERFEEAIKLFVEIPRKNVISYTALIDGYVRKGDIESARALFDRMPLKNDVSWTVMISGYVENGKFEEARELFEKMTDKNMVSMTAMLTGYSKQGKMVEAREIFENIQDKDRISWNAMITGYIQNGNGEEALVLHLEMLNMGLKPDSSTLVSVLTGCSMLPSLRKGRKTHALILKCGFELHLSVCNALITMYGKCGCVSDSELAFRQICKPDLVSWNAAIAAFALHGLLENAFDLLKKMEPEGVKPDENTFLSLLSACNHAGKVMESLSLFDSMTKGYGVSPRSEHYACLVDTLSRVGELEKAFKMIQEMPFVADCSVWTALLAGSSLYSNLEFGEVAARKIWELDPRHCGTYLMLSKIYASAGMWREVTRVRRLMNEQRSEKERACSWVEIGDEVHSFSGGDTSHLCIQKIHLELKQMQLQMKMGNDDAREILLEWS